MAACGRAWRSPGIACLPAPTSTITDLTRTGSKARKFTPNLPVGVGSVIVTPPWKAHVGYWRIREP
jgi:hypothetical protein